MSSRKLRPFSGSADQASSISGPRQQLPEPSQERSAQRVGEKVDEQAERCERYEQPERARARVQWGQPAGGAQRGWGAQRGRSAGGPAPLPGHQTPPTSPPDPPRPVPAFSAPGALPRSPPGSSPLLRRARVALKVAEACEKVDQAAQGRRTWGRAGGAR